MKAVVAIFEQLVPISGGGTPRTWHIVRTLARRGHDVHVAASFGIDPLAARAELNCAEVLALPLVSRLDRNKMLKYMYAYPWAILRLVGYIWRVKPDMVISHNTVAGFGALLGKRLNPATITVLDVTDLLFEYLESYRNSWIRPILALGRAVERYTLRRSDHVVTISTAMRDILVENYQVTQSRIKVVHDGVDCGVFAPAGADALRKRVSPWARHVCILHGVIDPQDEPEVLLEAVPKVLARLPNTAFWWVGDGAAVPGLRARAKELRLDEHVFFSGWISQAEVAEYVNASDLGIVVLPNALSARGRVTLKEFEYWACGKAAVLPRLPALQEVAPDGGASLFYTPGNPEDLADKISVLLEDDKRRQEMGQRGREMVLDRFEWRALTEQLVQLCEGYAAQHGIAQPVRWPPGGSR